MSATETLHHRAEIGLTPALLRAVTLNPQRQRVLDAANAESSGDGAWRARKQSEAHMLLAAAQEGPPGRLEVERLDLREDMRVVIRLDVPVPLQPLPDGRPQVARGALVGIAYPRLLLSRAVPGSSLACLLWPAHGAFHPNVLPDQGQPLCFGPRIAAATPLIELVVGSYGLLSMQNVRVDVRDPAGVLNREAALWWQENRHLIPLTRTPFFAAAGAEAPAC